MNKEDVIEFFDSLAASWDAHLVKDATKIEHILDYADVKPESKILDVACGTGVLINDYLNRNVEKVVAVDISPNMIKIAKEKYEDYPNVKFYCADIEEISLEEQFDCAIVFNAFPHFLDGKVLVETLAQKIKNGGKLTVAHDMGIGQLDRHHEGPAKKVSNKMIGEEEMAKLFAPYFDVDVKISNEQMYVVSGRKK